MSMEYLYDLAYRINEEVFRGVYDKGRCPYKDHSIRVSDHVFTIEEKIVALLHDVLEDSDLEGRDLINLGFPEYIVNTVILLTKRKDESYEDYINRLVESNNIVALHVKKADMDDNKDKFRMNKLDLETRERLTKKYRDNYYKIVMSLENK